MKLQYYDPWYIRFDREKSTFMRCDIFLSDSRRDEGNILRVRIMDAVCVVSEMRYYMRVRISKYYKFLAISLITSKEEKITEL